MVSEDEGAKSEEDEGNGDNPFAGFGGGNALKGADEAEEELDAVGNLLREAAVIDPQQNRVMSRASLPAPPLRGASGKENVFWE